MKQEADWERLADPQMISARYMIMLALFIEVVVQTFALVVQPTAWWTWQLLGFITATNLAAVILAIMAQKTANDIGASTKLAFTPSFYKTMTLLSKFQEYFEEEAAKVAENIRTISKAATELSELTISATAQRK